VEGLAAQILVPGVRGIQALVRGLTDATFRGRDFKQRQETERRLREALERVGEIQQEDYAANLQGAVPLVAVFGAACQVVAERAGFSLVLEMPTEGAWYVAPRVDLTRLVLRELERWEVGVAEEASTGSTSASIVRLPEAPLRDGIECKLDCQRSDDLPLPVYRPA